MNNITFIDHNIDTLLVVGDKVNKSKNYLFGYPTDISVDIDGNIYVYDTQSIKIKKYTGDGVFVKAIGSRGRGPGEFKHVDDVHIHGNNLIVVDESGISKFGLNGELRETYRTDPMPENVVNASSNKMFFLNYSRSLDNIVHEFSKTFKPTGEAFVSADEVVGRHPIEQVRARHEPGHVAVIDSSHVVYSPYLYDGRLFEYTKSENGWTRDGVWKGYTQTEDPYTTVPPNTEGVAMLSRANGRDYAYIKHNHSRQLFATDERVLHFTVIERGEKRTFGCEVYDHEGNLLGYTPIEDAPLNENGGPAGSLPWVKATRSSDTFYAIKRGFGNIPKVLVFRLAINEQR